MALPDEVYGEVVTTPHINAWVAALNTVGRAANPGSTMTFTGTKNNQAIPSTTVPQPLFLPWNGASDAQLNGLEPGVEGQLAVILNWTSTKVLYLGHNQTGLPPADTWCLWNKVTSGATPIASRGVAILQYTAISPFSGRWMLIYHDQGLPITQTFNAGNYGATGGTWVVASGNVGADEFKVESSDLLINLIINGTQVTSTPSNIGRTLYGYTAKSVVQIGCLINDNGAGWINGFIAINPSNTTVYFSRVDGANFATSASSTGVAVQVRIPLE